MSLKPLHFIGNLTTRSLEVYCEGFSRIFLVLSIPGVLSCTILPAWGASPWLYPQIRMIMVTSKLKKYTNFPVPGAIRISDLSILLA